MFRSEVPRPEPHETELTGSWIREAGKFVPDDTAKRITILLRNWFNPVAEAGGGWERLLRDPSDGRLWELTFPKSGMHGGGPPALRVVSADVARAKYGIVV